MWTGVLYSEVTLRYLVCVKNVWLICEPSRAKVCSCFVSKLCFIGCAIGSSEYPLLGNQPVNTALLYSEATLGNWLVRAWISKMWGWTVEGQSVIHVSKARVSFQSIWYVIRSSEKKGSVIPLGIGCKLNPRQCDETLPDPVVEVMCRAWLCLEWLVC